MQTLERATDRGFWNEELNRARHEIQSKWNENERLHRRQIAEFRQRSLARMLEMAPMDRTAARQPA